MRFWVAHPSKYVASFLQTGKFQRLKLYLYFSLPDWVATGHALSVILHLYEPVYQSLNGSVSTTICFMKRFARDIHLDAVLWLFFQFLQPPCLICAPFCPELVVLT